MHSVAGKEKQGKKRSRQDVGLSIHLQLNMTAFASSAWRMTSACREHISHQMRLFINLQIIHQSEHEEARLRLTLRSKSTAVTKPGDLKAHWRCGNFSDTAASSAIRNSVLCNMLKHDANRITRGSDQNYLEMILMHLRCAVQSTVSFGLL